MRIPETLRGAYVWSIVEIDLGHGRLVVEPADRGHVEGPYPDDVEVVHVVTAWNPQSQSLPPEINAARQRRLRAVASAIPARWSVAAVGRSVDGTWSEDSLAIADADEDAVLGLARRFEQYAVYAWTRDERAVVWTTQDGRDSTGWRCTWTSP